MMFNRLKGLSFRYFLSIAGKARLSLARFIIIIFSSLYFCVRLNFGFDIPLVIYVAYTILVNIIFMSIYFLSPSKFERILKSYLNFFYDRFFLFNKLVNMYLEFYLGFFKVPLYGFSFIYVTFMCLSIGSQEFALGVLLFFGFLGLFSFTLFGLFAQGIEYMTTFDADRWDKKSEIMQELITIQPVFLSIQSYYPLKFHNNELMQHKILFFLNSLIDKTNIYYQQEYRTMRIFAHGSHIRNFVVLNGKMIAIGSVAAGTLGTGGFLLNEERKRYHDGQQREKDRQHDGHQRDKDRDQRDRDRELQKEKLQLEREKLQFERDKSDKGANGFLSGLFGKNKGSGTNSSLAFDFVHELTELCSTLYIIFLGNSFFVSAFINFVVSLIKKIVLSL